MYNNVIFAFQVFNNNLKHQLNILLQIDYHVKTKYSKTLDKSVSKFSSPLSIFLIFTLRLSDLERIKPTQKNGRKESRKKKVQRCAVKSDHVRLYTCEIDFGHLLKSPRSRERTKASAVSSVVRRGR